MPVIILMVDQGIEELNNDRITGQQGYRGFCRKD
jgi:hypothetical protein